MSNIDSTALFKLSYGLFVITAEDEARKNGCIINTALQLTSSPLKIAVCVNKANYTNELIAKSGKFTLSILDETAEFSLFERFGFTSGRDTDKFAGLADYALADNSLPYLTKNANAFISAEVTDSVDCGTHTLFIAEVTQAEKLSGEKSMTYEYYFANVKPKPQAEKKKGYVCKICGYVHEGELPDDFICPLCKHPASDFEPIS